MVRTRRAGGSSEHESRCLAYFLDGASVGDDDLYVMINGHWEDRTFTVQEGAPSEWRRVVDTAQPSPEDIVEPGKEPKLDVGELPGARAFRGRAAPRAERLTR